MKNHQGKNTNTNVLGKIIKLTVQSSFAVTMMAAPSMAASFSFTPISTYAALDVAGDRIFDDSAATNIAFDPTSQKLSITNNSLLQLDVLNISDPSNPDLDFSISFLDEDLKQKLGGFNVGGVNDVAYSDDIFAVALENDTVTEDGIVAFFDSDGGLVNYLTVGPLPDMLTFTPNGSQLLVANEGEPNGEYTIDPEGSVSIIDMLKGAENLTQDDVKFAGFQAFNDKKQDLIDQGVRIFGPNATVAQDLEPEYIAVQDDGKTAYVTLQENNALGILDLSKGEFTDIVALGFKDHSKDGNGLDGSDDDGKINITTYENLFGMYQPDGVDTFRVGGKTYIVTANEGDSREYEFENEEGEEVTSFSEETEVRKVALDPTAFPNAAELQDPAVLGNFEITNTLGDPDGDGFYNELFGFGTRSFSIWEYNNKNLEGERLTRVFDSGDAFERIIAQLLPEDFNSTNDENGSFDDRSDNKGPEPEGITIAQVGDRILAFIGLERISGIMVYDITDPENPFFVDYLDNRDFNGDPENGTAGDLGPEGLKFISAEDSPNKKPLLIAANEVSGTTTIYEINSVPEPGTIFGLLAFGAAGKLLLKRKSKTTEDQEKA